MIYAHGSRRSLGAALAGAAILLAAMPSPAALAAGATGHVSVTILPAAAGVGGVPAMIFGTVGGTGAPSQAAALTLSGRASGPAAYSFGSVPAAGSVTVTGIPDTPVTVSLSAGDVVRGPGAAMPFRVVAAAPGAMPALDHTGVLRLALGATLSVGRQQAPGAYHGTYAVTVDY